MRNRPYQRGVRNALRRVGLKVATAPEMGDLQVSPAFTPSTGDSGQTMGRTNENPQAQVSTAFNEHARHNLLEPHASTTFPVGGNQSLNTRTASIATFDELRNWDTTPVQPDTRAKSTGGAFYEQGKGIGYDPDMPDPTNMVAHEMGHAELDKSFLGSAMQSPTSRLMHMTGPTLAGALGWMNKTHGRAMGAGASALMSAPTILSEAAAHYKGYNKLKDVGASEAELSDYLRAAAPAMGSYLAMPVLGAGMAALGHRAKFGAAHAISRRLKFRGFDVSIETDKGEYRHWYDKAAQREGKTKMLYPYGYIRMTRGMDGDHVDCFIGPNEQADKVYVVTTNKAPDFKEVDEQKCMLGFDSAEAAKTAFMAHYDKPGFFRSMKAFAYADFETKVFATKDGVNKKIARDTYQVDDRLIDNSPGSMQDQTPGDFLGMPFRTRLLGQTSIVGGNPAAPDDRIDQMFRHHDEDMNTHVLEGNTDAMPLDPGV